MYKNHKFQAKLIFLAHGQNKAKRERTFSEEHYLNSKMHFEIKPSDDDARAGVAPYLALFYLFAVLLYFFVNAQANIHSNDVEIWLVVI